MFWVFRARAKPGNLNWALRPLRPVPDRNPKHPIWPLCQFGRHPLAIRAEELRWRLGARLSVGRCYRGSNISCTGRASTGRAGRTIKSCFTCRTDRTCTHVTLLRLRTFDFSITSLSPCPRRSSAARPIRSQPCGVVLANSCHTVVSPYAAALPVSIRSSAATGTSNRRPIRMVGISFRLAASYADPREIRRITAASLSVTTRRSGGVVSSFVVHSILRHSNRT